MSDARFCSITTTGRVTGKPHEIEIWFVRRADTIYVLMGGGEDADTARNVRKSPRASVRMGETTYAASGRIVDDPSESAWVREELPRKYTHEEDGLEEWAEGALPVAFDLETSTSVVGA